MTILPRDRAFVDELCMLALGHDRLAALLRRGVSTGGPRQEALMCLLGHRLALPAAEAQAHLQVACLLAWHPLRASEGNLGETCGALRREGITGTLERRFACLLDADREEALAGLRGIIGLARVAQLPVHWEQLLADLRHWESPAQGVQLDWARAFWGPPEPADGTMSGTTWGAMR